MVTDTVQDKQIRRSIISEVNGMDLRMLQRIAYVFKCQQLDIHPDGWKLYPEENQ